MPFWPTFLVVMLLAGLLAKLTYVDEHDDEFEDDNICCNSKEKCNLCKDDD